MALGAERTGILRMVLREGCALAVCGIGMGIPAALATSRLISAQPFGVKPTDPATVAGCALVMTIVAGLAGYPGPARFTHGPVVALRYE